MRQAPQRLLRAFLALSGLALLCLHAGCAPRLLGPTRPSGYVFTLTASEPLLWLGQVPVTWVDRFPKESELRVRVQNAQGQPVDGVPVTFAVEPGWAQSASITPPQVETRGGIARAILQVRTTGVVHVLAGVEATTASASITVVSYESSSHTQ